MYLRLNRTTVGHALRFTWRGFSWTTSQCTTVQQHQVPVTFDHNSTLAPSSPKVSSIFR